MEKKLPKVYANKITKEIENNKKIYVSNSKVENKKETINSEKEIKIEETIEKKINEIFKLKKTVYKIPVIIKVNNEEKSKYIIGKNKKNIITIENEIIPIDIIEDIKIQKKDE